MRDYKERREQVEEDGEQWSLCRSFECSLWRDHVHWHTWKLSCSLFPDSAQSCKIETWIFQTPFLFTFRLSLIPLREFKCAQKYPYSWYARNAYKRRKFFMAKQDKSNDFTVLWVDRKGRLIILFFYYHFTKHFRLFIVFLNDLGLSELSKKWSYYIVCVFCTVTLLIIMTW